MSKYRLGLEILINESFYDNAIMALKKLVYSVKDCDANAKETAIKSIMFKDTGIKQCMVPFNIAELYKLNDNYNWYSDWKWEDETNPNIIFNTLCYYNFNKYVESGVKGSNILKFSDICIDSEQEKECAVYETNYKVHVLFLIPENIDDVKAYKELAKITKNPVTVYTDCSNSTEYNDIGLRDLNVEAYESEYAGGNITISVLKLPIDKYVDDEFRLYALKLIYEDCDYVNMCQEPDEGLIDLIRLIGTIESNKLIYRYEGTWYDYYRCWIMSKNIANFTIRNAYKDVDMNVGFYRGKFEFTDVELRYLPLITMDIKEVDEKRRKLREKYASASSRDKDINLSLYQFDFGIVVPLEVKNKGSIEVTEKWDESDTDEHTEYINSIMGTVYTAISGLLVKNNVPMLKKYSNKLQKEVKTFVPLTLSEIQELLLDELEIRIYTTDIRIKRIYEANKSNTDAVITKILKNRLYVLTPNKYLTTDQWQEQIETIDTNIVISFVTSYYFDYDCRFINLLKTLTYISGNAVTVYEYNELNKAAYVIYPYKPACKSKLFFEFIRIKDDCSYKSELAVGLMALMRKCKFIANYDMYASISFPLVNLLKAINDNPDASIIKLKSDKKYEDDSYIISSEILKSQLTVSDNYVLKSNLGIDALNNAKVHETVYSLDVFNFEFKQKGTFTVCRKGDCISIAANEKLKGGYERINPWFILFILLITVLVTYIIVMICNACKNNELFTASKTLISNK